MLSIAILTALAVFQFIFSRIKVRALRRSRANFKFLAIGLIANDQFHGVVARRQGLSRGAASSEPASATTSGSASATATPSLVSTASGLTAAVPADDIDAGVAGGFQRANGLAFFIHHP